MTAWLCDRPYLRSAGHGLTPIWSWHFWTDQWPIWDALLGEPWRYPHSTEWPRAGLTEAQMRLAVGAGALITDKYGPSEWLACRKGDIVALAHIQRMRQAFP